VAALTASPAVAGGVACRHGLYLSDVYFPRVNGVSTSIATFRRELPAQGVATTLIAPGYGGEPPAGDVVRLRGRAVPFDREDRFVAPRAFERAAAGRAFDFVHVQTPFSAHRAGVRIARRRRVPLVETWHTDFEGYFEHYLPLVPRGWARAVARRLARRVAREVDHLVVPSQAIARRLESLGLSTPATVVPTGVSVDDLGAGDGGRFRVAHGIAADRPVAVHVGRVAHEKNLGLLLDVADRVRRRIPDLLLVIAGEGPARDELRRRTVELGLTSHLRFVGYLDRRRELADAYRAGDCFVFTSLTETQGLVLLEAMALGVPVVSVAAGGTLDLLVEGCGALVPPPEVEPFAAAVERVLASAELRTQMAEAGLRHAAQWRPAEFARRLATLYGSLVDERRDAGRQALSR
jgi:glycosyltransferase involved in cell wall biosynthesis